MGDDQADPGVTLDERGEIAGDGWEPAASVDQDRNVPLTCERENRRDALVPDREALRPRMQFDPPGAAVEATDGFVER